MFMAKFNYRDKELEQIKGMSREEFRGQIDGVVASYFSEGEPVSLNRRS